MDNFYAFLHPVQTNLEKEVVISKRFVDENGEPIPFKIRALSQEENDRMLKQSTKVEIKNGQRVEYVDNVEYCRRLVVAATVYPDFSAKELCEGYDVASPLLVPVKMLLSGEYSTLVSEIMELSGVDVDVNAPVYE